jgi:AmmeMemoRadiSam system protein B
MNRTPAVAGSFYPADAHKLQTSVAHFLQDVKTTGTEPKAIIAPHAGYIYSGPIAASAYALLKPAAAKIKRVILMGPSHRIAFKGLALSSCDRYSTPLGDIQLDKEAIEGLQQFSYLGYLDQAHTQEHSLEVHLPFLQEVLDDFTLVPIVAGDANPEQVASVLEQLWGGEETLLVISSDLSHYHDYATAQRLDRQTSDLIETLQYDSISNEAACGKVPVCGFLKLLEQKSLNIETIDLRNSGDTAGDKQRVVGYGAYVVN